MKTYTPEEAKTVRPCAACSYFGHDRNCSFCGGTRSPLTLSTISGEDKFIIAKRGRDWPVNLTVAVLLLLALSTSAQAQGLRIPSAVFVGINAADIVSTQRALTVPGAYEVNPLGQSAGARVAVKSLTTLGVLAVAHQVGKTHPKVAKGLLWASSAIVGVAVANNARIGQ